MPQNGLKCKMKKVDEIANISCIPPPMAYDEVSVRANAESDRKVEQRLNNSH
jgi:hypothetical protein